MLLMGPQGTPVPSNLLSHSPVTSSKNLGAGEEEERGGCGLKRPQSEAFKITAGDEEEEATAGAVPETQQLQQVYVVICRPCTQLPALPSIAEYP